MNTLTELPRAPYRVRAGYFVLSMLISLSSLTPPQDIWQYLETFLAVIVGGHKLLLHAMSKSQRSSKNSIEYKLDRPLQ